MKNSTLAILLIAISIAVGALSYLTSKYFVKGYFEILPVVLFILLISLFSKKLRATIKPVVGLPLLFFIILIPLSVLFFLMLSYPLPGMTAGLQSTDITIRYLAIVGISSVCGLILGFFIYRKNEVKERLKAE